ncbi:MAG TPA: peptidoglycan-binding protein [Bacillales bacterium]|nr:peptidoglycan-binding protein [Bacillales bacterium]
METGKTIKKFITAGTFAAGLMLAVPLVSEASGSTATINTHQLLTIGDQGQPVRSLQSRLKGLDYYSYSVDGIYGPITRSSVRNYQREHGLAVDGIAGPNTLGSLFHSNRSTNHGTSELLQAGDRGQAVTRLQNKLQDFGYYTYAVDGVYAPITEDAVRSFQAENDLAVDGIAGPHTLGALYDGEVVAAAESGSGGGGAVSDIIADAKALIGTPYVWGGDSPSGFDCSGFIHYVFEKNGVNLPRTTAAIWDYADPAGAPERGDLVFFETYTDGPSHVGIYLGNGKFIEAGSSSGVTITDMDYDYWSSRYLGAKTVL